MYVSVFERVYTARGMEKGREEGREEGKLEVARNLLAEGISPDIISRTSGISLEEVQNLQN
jgi:predicted transposase/invertase (TIGR01784 family)